MSMGHTDKFFGFSICYTILNFPLFCTYILCLFPVPFPPLSSLPVPTDNPPCDLHFCDSLPVLVLGLVCFCFLGQLLISSNGQGKEWNNIKVQKAKNILQKWRQGWDIFRLKKAERNYCQHICYIWNLNEVLQGKWQQMEAYIFKKKKMKSNRHAKYVDKYKR